MRYLSLYNFRFECFSPISTSYLTIFHEQGFLCLASYQKAIKTPKQTKEKEFSVRVKVVLHPVSSLLLPFLVYTFVQQQPRERSFFAYQQPKVRVYFRRMVYSRLFIGIYLLSEVTAMHLFNSLG